MSRVRDTGFTTDVSVYNIRSGFWLPVATVLLILSCTCLSLDIRSTPFACSCVPHWCIVCPPTLAHSCHMASPPPVCEPPWCPSSWFSALFQLSSTCRFIQLAVFSLPSSADKFWTSSSPSSYATLFGRRIIGSWTCRFQNVFIYLQVLEFVGQNKP